MRLTEIAKRMKLEAYQTGKSERKLFRGLEITLTPYKDGWKLKMERENTEPSKTEYKVVSKAFFDGRVHHLQQPSKNALELITVKNL